MLLVCGVGYGEREGAPPDTNDHFLVLYILHPTI
jgi:hypothetical protein